MTYGLQLVSAPAAEAISLAEVKAHCNIWGTDNDALLAGYVMAARQHVEQTYGLALRTQTLELSLDEFPSDEVIPLPRGPVQSITSVQYVDLAGVTQTWAGANYVLDNRRHPARLVQAYNVPWPSTRDQINAVTIRFVAGYADGALPDPIRSALLLLVSHFYENREPVNVGNIVTPFPFSVDALLSSYRISWLT